MPFRIVNMSGNILRALARSVATASQYPGRAVALNVLYEKRASLSCEAAVSELIPGSGDGVYRLSQALKAYLTNNVRKYPSLTFLAPHNSENAVVLSDDEKLINVWNVSRFLTGLDENDRAVAAFFDQNRLSQAPSTIADWLQGIGRHQERLEAVLDLHNDYRTRHPYHPVWAAPWTQAEKALTVGDPNTWLEAVGLTPPSAGSEYLVLFRYKSKDAKPLRRPSQYEAGWFALHFPSPPIAPPLRGGFTLLCDQDSPCKTLVSEYIHAQVDWGITDVLNSGWTRPGPSGRLDLLRLNHFRRLQDDFHLQFQELLVWMQNPDRLPDENNIDVILRSGVNS